MADPVVHFEIHGPDRTALQQFYSELFGWHVSPVVELDYATIDTHGGTGINGGIGPAYGEPFSTVYADVADVQAALDKAVSAGASVVMPLTELPGIVTMAMVSDPQANVIGIMKGEPTEQGGVSKGDGVPVTWFEILGPEPKVLRDFYTEVFGWELGESSGGEYEYYEVHPEQGIGGGIGSSPDGKGHVTIYAEVEDLQAYLEKAETLGGKTLMPPMDVEGEISFAQFADPQGVAFGLFRRIS